jgi:hypothetical protein
VFVVSGMIPSALLSDGWESRPMWIPSKKFPCCFWCSFFVNCCCCYKYAMHARAA